jgi:hypothetical protein
VAANPLLNAHRNTLKAGWSAQPAFTWLLQGYLKNVYHACLCLRNHADLLEFLGCVRMAAGGNICQKPPVRDNCKASPGELRENQFHKVVKAQH